MSRFVSAVKFCLRAFSDRPLASNLVRQTTYWVYDPDLGNYGPGKFVGFASMSYETYRSALQVNPPEFDGGRTRRAIEAATELDFEPDEDCARGLVFWAEELLDERIMEGVAPDKWHFLRLPVSAGLPVEFWPIATVRRF